MNNGISDHVESRDEVGRRMGVVGNKAFHIEDVNKASPLTNSSLNGNTKQRRPCVTNLLDKYSGLTSFGGQWYICLDENRVDSVLGA